jgi:ATP-dependent helicase YprA (DUF1998 family)
MLDPLETTRRIDDAFLGYLRSSFGPRRPELRDAYHRALNEGGDLSRGPFVQATAPFKPGRSVDELIRAGVLSAGMRDLAESFPLDRPLHGHQEAAILKSVEHERNLVVSTGTGSGKTEAFLFPIIEHLLGEREAGTLGKPGVRALLLYPMNALANDQVKRLRGLLAPLPEITFGRYTGETEETQLRAESDFQQRYPGATLHPNELISRQVMKERPPHLLLTNYAMLEYLLLRPDDTPFFDGEHAKSWKFLVLDEAHVYNGAQGTEVAYLLRRLKDRVLKSEQGRLRCFATSATLGRGVEDNPQLVEFAEQLFGESFEWSEADPSRQDVVSATRLPLTTHQQSAHEFTPAIIERLHECFRQKEPAAARLGKIADRTDLVVDNDVPSTLHNLLGQDANVLRLQQALAEGSVELQRLAALTFPAVSGRDALTVQLIDLCVNARHQASDTPLLPARYHHFVRSLEGAFVCLHPDHPPATPKISLQRFAHCQGCSAAGRTTALLELATCRHCRAEYIVGVPEPTSGGYERLARANEFDGDRRYYLLGEAVDADDDDQMSTNIAAETTTGGLELCTSCGSVLEIGGQCACGGSSHRMEVTLVEPGKGHRGAVQRCASCAGRSSGEVLFRFLTGTDAPVSVVATELYQNLPPSADDEAADQVGEGRKLLTFSDSRQDAAFFAGYLERTYGRALHRALIWKVVSEARDTLRTDNVVDEVMRLAEEHKVLDIDQGRVTNRNEVAGWLHEELLAIDRRQSLEGTGLVHITTAVPSRYETPPPLLTLGLTQQQADGFIQLLLSTLRSGGAISAPPGVDIRDERFAPRNRAVSLRIEGADFGVLGWAPSAPSLNRRLDIARKVFERLNIDDDPVEVIRSIWAHLSDRKGPWKQTLIESSDRRQGALWTLDSAKFEFIPLSPGKQPFRCDRCSQVSWWNVAEICPAWRCTGTLERVVDSEEILDGHYAKLYRRLQPISLSAQEHTAQWTSKEASAVQDKFVDGDVNVLSCSTTFEMGVDVGDIQAVLLRNVPPGVANYVQRAGRAGRRTDSAALVVTFAQRRNHDRNFYEHPDQMIDGVVPTPSVVLDNVHIARRHSHSVAFAQYLRQLAELGQRVNTVGDFFSPESTDSNPADDFAAWLCEGPDELQTALKRLLPAPITDSIGVDGWDWVPALLDENEEDPTHGWYARAGAEVSGELDQIETMLNEAIEEKRYAALNGFKHLEKTLRNRQLVGFLASRNVLPKYGFPVDVVELNLRGSGHPLAGRVELTRDLKLAITDYSPGNQVVAGKTRWISTGLATRPGHAWPVYGWAVCEDCQSFRRALAERPEECHVCGSLKTKQSGKFIVPIYGFVGRAEGDSGESRPRKIAFAEPYFSTDDDAEFEVEDGLASAILSSRMSRQGRITMINRGGGAGYQVCSWCGFGSAPVGGSRGKRSHEDLRRPGRTCEGPLTNRHLGHEFLTDVVELKIASRFDLDTAYGVLYSLIESSRDLGVNREELDGTLYVFSKGSSPAIVLFDAVPGGAGHCQRIARQLPALIQHAFRRADSCSCGRDTSCYSCLRSYGNQRRHETLDRGRTADVLAELLRA